MNKICFKTSIALDAIFYLKKCSMKDEQWMPLNQAPKNVILEHPLFKLHYNEIEKFKNHFPIPKYNYKYDMSTMGLILSTFTDNDLENLTLDNLIKILQSPEQLCNTVKTRIANGFNTLHVYPLLEELKSDLGNKLIYDITILKDNGFEKFYSEHILPHIHNEIEIDTEKIKDYDFEKLFKNISLLKNSDIIPSATIYLTFFSLPYGLSLYNGAYSACYTGETQIDFFELSAHELMHGFANEETLSLYTQYTQSNDFLRKAHSRLLNEFGSGNEEEFVKAAEYYLCYLSGNYSKEHLYKIAKNEYDGCCPISVIFFDLLTKQETIPKDYNCWIKQVFESNILPKDNIQDYISKLI